jgi:hypothetical protein
MDEKNEALKPKFETALKKAASTAFAGKSYIFPPTSDVTHTCYASAYDSVSGCRTIFKLSPV